MSISIWQQTVWSAFKYVMTQINIVRYDIYDTMARRRQRSRKSGRKTRKSVRRSLLGGKRSLSPALRSWIASIKKVQKERGISYKEAMVVAAKLRKQ